MDGHRSCQPSRTSIFMICTEQPDDWDSVTQGKIEHIYIKLHHVQTIHIVQYNSVIVTPLPICIIFFFGIVFLQRFPAHLKRCFHDGLDVQSTSATRCMLLLLLCRLLPSFLHLPQLNSCTATSRHDQCQQRSITNTTLMYNEKVLIISYKKWHSISWPVYLEGSLEHEFKCGGTKGKFCK